jgi:rhamnose transport system permease protein
METLPCPGGPPAISATSATPTQPAVRYHAEPFWRRRETVLGAALLLLTLAMSLLTQGSFAQPDNLRDILVNAAIPAIGAAGMTALIISAEIDISIGANLAVSAVVVALLAQRGLPIPILIVAGVATGALLGSVNGLLTAGLKIPSIVATLATLGAIRGLLVLVTHGDSLAIPGQVTSLGTSAPLGLPLPVCMAVVVCVAAAALLARTRPGRQHYAVGSNRRAAVLSGVPTGWVTFRAFVLLGAVVGLAAFVYVTRFTPVYPTMTGRGYELEVITAVVVGGTDIFGGVGTVGGSVVAAVLLSAVTTSLTFLGSKLPWLSSETQPAIQGLMILIAVLYNSLGRRDA